MISTTPTIERWRTMIVATGAVDWIEDMITERVARPRSTSTGSSRRVSAGSTGQHGDGVHGARRMKVG